MTRIYITYGMILLSSFLVYWLYGIVNTASPGSNWLPVTGFLSSIFHFSISSWVFLKFARTGRILSILSAAVMCIWPLVVIFDSLQEKNIETAAIFAVPVILSVFVIRNQAKTYLTKEKPESIGRALMILIPPAIVITYEMYIWNFVYEK